MSSVVAARSARYGGDGREENHARWRGRSILEIGPRSGSENGAPRLSADVATGLFVRESSTRKRVMAHAAPRGITAISCGSIERTPSSVTIFSRAGLRHDEQLSTGVEEGAIGHRPDSRRRDERPYPSASLGSPLPTSVMSPSTKSCACSARAADPSASDSAVTALPSKGPLCRRLVLERTVRAVVRARPATIEPRPPLRRVRRGERRARELLRPHTTHAPAAAASCDRSAARRRPLPSRNRCRSRLDNAARWPRSESTTPPGRTS